MSPIALPFVLLVGAQTPLFQSQTDSVLVRFHAIQKDRYAEDFKPEDVEIWEDGQKQPIAFFEGPHTKTRTSAVHLIVALDVSGSVEIFRPMSSSLLKSTILAGLDQHAQISLYSFAVECRLLVGPTRDLDRIGASLQAADRIDTKGSNIFDSITQICQDVRRGPDWRNVLIVFSDGFNNSSATGGKALKASRDADVVLYPVVLCHRSLDTWKENKT